jgi:hypothetical protein
VIAAAALIFWLGAVTIQRDAGLVVARRRRRRHQGKRDQKHELQEHSQKQRYPATMGMIDCEKVDFDGSILIGEAERRGMRKPQVHSVS